MFCHMKNIKEILGSKINTTNILKMLQFSCLAILMPHQTLVTLVYLYLTHCPKIGVTMGWEFLEKSQKRNPKKDSLKVEEKQAAIKKT